jgi:hypothetical protein
MQFFEFHSAVHQLELATVFVADNEQEVEGTDQKSHL